jgi:hypothetical protein
MVSAKDLDAGNFTFCEFWDGLADHVFIVARLYGYALAHDYIRAHISETAPIIEADTMYEKATLRLCVGWWCIGDRDEVVWSEGHDGAWVGQRM